MKIQDGSQNGFSKKVICKLANNTVFSKFVKYKKKIISNIVKVDTVTSFVYKQAHDNKSIFHDVLLDCMPGIQDGRKCRNLEL